MILSSLGNYGTIKKINILSYSIFGLILVVDQLVLPMFHLGNLPYKVSYFLLLFWFISFLLIPNKTLLQIKDRKLFFQFSLAIGIIIVCGIIGDTFVNFFTKIDSLAESFKSYTTYFFVILSFGL